MESTNRKKLRPQISATFSVPIFMEVTVLCGLNFTKIDEVMWAVRVEMHSSRKEKYACLLTDFHETRPYTTAFCKTLLYRIS